MSFVMTKDTVEERVDRGCSYCWNDAFTIMNIKAELRKTIRLAQKAEGSTLKGLKTKSTNLREKLTTLRNYLYTHRVEVHNVPVREENTD